MGKHILLLGIGQTGCDVSEAFLHRMNDGDTCVHALAVDTDERAFVNISLAHKVPMVQRESLLSTVDRLGRERVGEFFPCEWTEDGTDFARGLPMDSGANLWRMKAYLSFMAFTEDEELCESLDGRLSEVIAEASGSEIELYTVTSLVGGTGSALLLPLTLYVKRYIKAQGGTVSNSSAMLLLPEIFENQLTAEQRVKAYANAYATLRELNTVNITALSECGDSRPESLFRLGSEKMRVGLLFDSEGKQFKTKEAAPFDKVVLLARTPGVNTVGGHVGIAADILVSAAVSGISLSDTDKSKEKNSMAIYEGIALTRVRYSPDSITEYISLKETERLICDELASAHRAAKRAARAGLADARSLAFRGEVDETEQYCNALIACAESAMEEGGEDAFISRAPLGSVNDSSGIDVWREDYVKASGGDYMKLLSAIEAGLVCDASEDIKRFISKMTEDADNINNNRKKKDKATRPPSKKERRQRLVTDAARVGKCLVDYYESCRELLIRGDAEFTESLLANSAEEGGFSLISDLMMREGAARHPLLSLLRLCMLYKHLKAHVAAGSESEEEKFLASEELPEELLILDSDVGGSRYAMAGEKRFVAFTRRNVREVMLFGKARAGENEEIRTRAVIEVTRSGLSKKKYLLSGSERVFSFASDEELKQKLSDDAELFVSDLGRIYERIRLIAEEIRCRAALRTVGALIDRYCELLDSALAFTDDLRSDARLSAIYASSDNGVIINIATSPEEKAGAHAEFLTTYTAQEREGDDALLTRRFVDAVVSDSESYRIDEIADFVKKTYQNRFKNSDFYKKNIDKNVLMALLDSIDGRFAPATLGYDRVFGERFAPIRVMRADAAASGTELLRSTHAIFPDGVWSCVSDNPDRFGECDPKTFFEKKLYDAGEYRGVATHSPSENDREFLIRREISGITPGLLEQFNESSYDPVGYNCYERAKAAARAHKTAMWNPDLVYKRDSERPLPLISEAAQREYELSSARALLYAQISHGLYLSDLDGVGEVYYTYSDGAAAPILLRGETVGAKNVKALAEWAYSNPDFVSENSEKFSAMFHGKVALHGGFAAYRRYAASLSRSASVAALAETFSSLLIKLYSAKALDFSGYAESIAAGVYDTVTRQSIGDSMTADDGTACVYNALVDLILSRLIKDAKGERARTLVAWLNTKGYFKRLTPPADFKNYEY